MNAPTNIAIIGHSNTGKTSLIRTLLRDDNFGEIKNAAATTRHVAQVAILAQDGTPLVCLYDTPGLEDATGVMDYISEHTFERDDGVDRLKFFLDKVADSCPDVQDFSQEAKAINALLNADLAIYVIDTRTLPTARYKDELAILVYAAVPILPVFNFIKDSPHIADWQKLLAQRALHVASLFDTVAFDFDNETQLWQHLIALSSTLPSIEHQNRLNTLKQQRQEQWQALSNEGSRQIAQFLINVARFSQKIASDTNPTATVIAMQTQVRQAEIAVMNDLLTLYRFYHSPLDVDTPAIALQQTDPFDPSELSKYGRRTVSGGGLGAMIGAGIDVATLGVSLGLGTLMGGLLGGGLANADTIKDKLTGTTRLSIDDDTLLVLANRLMNLHHTLRHTGHASRTLTTHPNQPRPNLSPILKIIAKARKVKPLHRLDKDGQKILDNTANLRQDLVQHLAVMLGNDTKAHNAKLIMTH